MKCPIDQTTLAITERQGIEIDYCPECRGVWLDRGELDKLIAGSSRPSEQSRERAPERYEERPKSGSYESSHDYHKNKKKESWLGEIFDF